MPDEANDKRIKEAAKHYHPAYDDKAWEKMEQLLNQHLPQKKKRRRFIFFLLPLILAGGVILFIVTENGRKDATHDQEITFSTGETVKPIPAPLTSNSFDGMSKKPSSKNSEIKQLISGRKENVSQIPHPGSRKNSTGATGTTFPIEKKWQENHLKNNRQNVTAKEEIKTKQRNFADNNPINEDNSVVEPLPSSSVIPSLNEKNILNQKENNKDIQLNKPVVNKSENIAKTEKDQTTATKTKKEAKRSKNNFVNNFGISISAGPDISGAHLDNPGKIAINLGLGVSYIISSSFTLRTGFYAAKKIYSVGPDDYKTTAGPGNYYYLENIDANCLVYSIPLNINYNFKKVKNHNWFLSTGLSSYLMKRETYEYYYKYPSGQAYTKDWTIHNQNQNFLSVLNLSGGYQYSFNNRISVMAEPYISLPLGGVGAGKVKLKSTGILFTFTVKPFLKKEK